MIDSITKLMIAAAVGSIPLHAFAASPVGNVGTAIVDAGALSAEWRGGYSWDESGSSTDRRLRMREHVDYGFNDWYAARLVVSQDKRNGDNLEHGSFTFENRFQLIERRTHGWDGGVRLMYGHSDGDKTPHELDFRLMAQVPFGENDEWEYRHNTVLEHDIGENSRHGVALEFRNQVTKVVAAPDFLKKLRVGIEMFNDFGRLRDTRGFDSQDHQIGPVIKGYLDNGFYFQTGYRAGLSDGSNDHLVKLFIGKSF